MPLISVLAIDLISPSCGARRPGLFVLDPDRLGRQRDPIADLLFGHSPTVIAFKSSDTGAFEILMQMDGEIIIAEHVGEQRECKLRGTAARISPFESSRRMIEEIAPHRQRATRGTIAMPNAYYAATVMIAESAIDFHLYVLRVGGTGQLRLR
jgi:hypothetical protein